MKPEFRTRLAKPFAEVILLKDGQLNFANMLRAPKSDPRLK